MFYQLENSVYEKSYFNIVNVRDELVSIIPFWFTVSPATHLRP